VEIVQWWNPLIYVLGNAMRDIHEYQADDYVLRHGVTLHEYQLLLIKKTVGSGTYTFANNFNHSLIKKRIIMMTKKSNQWRSCKALYVLPLSVLALSAFATPSFTQHAEEIREVTMLTDSPTKNVDTTVDKGLGQEKGKSAAAVTCDWQGNKKLLCFINGKQVSYNEMQKYGKLEIDNKKHRANFTSTDKRVKSLGGCTNEKMCKKLFHTSNPVIYIELQ